MGFGEKGRKWILTCLKSASVSVLVNGSPTHEFRLERRIRQGDPLSPFLFIIASEGLNILTKQAVHSGLFRGTSIVKTGQNFGKSFIRVIGNGGDTSFWEDAWLTDQPLKLTFARLYHMERNQAAKVQDRITWAANEPQILWDWIREFQGRAHADLLTLMNLLFSYVKQDRTLDAWYWNLSSNGIFTTKKLSRLIDDITILDNRSRTETMKNNLVPLKLEVFIWRTMRRRLPTKTELDKRGIDLDSVRCPLCDDDVESIDHSLFLCRHSYEVWDRVFKWWGF
ncbi:uncharacterized protein [Rutidosis leptorrhynchoides]|uniref:uncharacterized protein n=1 Tax=Rutidosis leptorrhynchoides TaxID=125765 RepID=UPI003A9A4C6B